MLNLGGTYREVVAEETLARIEPLLLPVFGITRVADVTGLDNINVHTVVAIRPNSKSLANAQGKGQSLVLAKTSALMEAIEVWHGENLPSPDLIGSYEQLSKAYTLQPLTPLMGGFYSTRLATESIGYVTTTDIVTGETVYFPHTFFNQDRAHFSQNCESFWPTTNGVASGNSMEEAQCHALFELIERHSRYHLNLSELVTRRVDLNYLPSDICVNMVNAICDKDYILRVYDLRTPLNIPVYMAIINDSNDIRNIGSFAGYGCHLSDEIALLRAITEAIQSRLTHISGARDDISSSLYLKKTKQLTKPLPGTHRPTYNEKIPSSFFGFLDSMIKTLYQHGYKRICSYDLTKPDINIPVTHMVIPEITPYPGALVAKAGGRI